MVSDTFVPALWGGKGEGVCITPGLFGMDPKLEELPRLGFAFATMGKDAASFAVEPNVLSGVLHGRGITIFSPAKIMLISVIIALAADRSPSGMSYVWEMAYNVSPSFIV